MIYVNNVRRKIVFEFIVLDIIGKWMWLVFSIKKDGVIFYYDCKEIEIKFGFLFFVDFSFLLYSVFYIGWVGWIFGVYLSIFEVSV